MVTYVFSDANRRTSYISDTELNLRGTWATGTVYSPPTDTVSYNGALWVAIQATSNLSPSTYSKIRYWSQLVTYKTSPPPTDVTRAQDTADLALSIATEGTDAAADALAVAQAGTTTANSAYLIAIAGTNLAASGIAGANQAYQLATVGTNLGLLAIYWLGTHSASDQKDTVARMTAWSGTAGVEQLLGMFTQGTSAGTIFTNNAVLTEAGSRAATDAGLQAQIDLLGGNTSYNALVTAWSGTAGATQAFNLAVSGTTQAQAALAQAQEALAIAQNGTESFDQIYVVAYSGTAGVGQVFPVANSGTAGVNQVYPIATAGTAGVEQLYPIANSGTAGVNQVYTVANSGTAGVNQVYPIAMAGTAGVNQLYPIAVAGTNLAATALAAAWAGTAASVPLAGGTMIGNLTAPQVFLSSGTTPTASAVSGTVYYDFLGPAYQETTVDQDLFVSVKNRTNGAEMAAVLVSNGTPYGLTYDASFAWFGTKIPYMSTTAGKTVVIAFAYKGTNASSGVVAPLVIAASSAQIE